MREFTDVLTVYEITRNKDGEIISKEQVNNYRLTPRSVLDFAGDESFPISKHYFNMCITAYEEGLR